jgi:hypothetical protein
MAIDVRKSTQATINAPAKAFAAIIPTKILIIG